MQFSPLLDVITLLLDGTNLSFNIMTTSTILNSNIMYLPPSYYLHANTYCSAAKTTLKGLNTCLLCKKMTNAKLFNEKKPFWGYCAYGIMEYVYPIIIDNNVKCIFYIGNIVADKSRTIEKIRHRCHLTSVSSEKMISALKSCEINADLNKVEKIAQIIDSYICLLSSKITYDNDNLHWAVLDAKQTAETLYSEPLTLKQCADKIFINEKYLGRIFKEQLGKSFHEYLNEVRLQRAKSLLTDTVLSIATIAYECGFSNIPYFNRTFKKRFGATPSYIRKSKSRRLN